MTEFEGLKVEGANIAAKKAEDRYFEIVGEARYELIPSLSNKDEKVKKLIIPVKLNDGSLADYYPNMTSSRVIAGLAGTNMTAWIGKSFFWDIADQRINDTMKKVLYVRGFKV